MKPRKFYGALSLRTVEFPIQYCFSLDDLEGWAESCRCSRDELVNATELGLRFRRHNAFVAPRNRRSQYQPDVFTLSLGVGQSATVFYTIESHAIVVRGFGWEIVGEPLDDSDGGSYHCDYEWIALARQAKGS